MGNDGAALGAVVFVALVVLFLLLVAYVKLVERAPPTMSRGRIEDPRIATIRSFANLQEGWDSYGASPIRPESIELAIRILPSLPPNAHPSPDNDEGVTFEWDEGEDTFIVTFWGMKKREVNGDAEA